MTAPEYPVDDVHGYLQPSYLPPVYLGRAVPMPVPPVHVSDLSCLSCGGTEVATNHVCEEPTC